MEATLPRRFGPSAEGGDEDRVQSLGVRREEPNDLVVIEREPRRAEALRVGGEVGAPADEPGLEVGEAGAAVAPRGEQRIERREEEDRRRGVTAERLLQRQVRRLTPELSGRERLQRVVIRPVSIGAWRDTVHGVDDQKQVD